ncbi:hypothetical protein LWI28_000321 [Acer negundo]|uniref:Uncharacterized protein n=1 Tax=Acer negundo TaxID=4023 RepID=A0AAD5NMI3_ACENE|nr:hypothetical protein LWI28_000321 [Acer negundo]
MDVSLIEAMNLPFTYLEAFMFSTIIRLQLLRRTPRLGLHEDEDEDDDDGDVRLRASPPSTEGSSTHPRDMKRKHLNEASTLRVAKETAGKKAAKTGAGTSAPKASLAQKNVTVEVSVEAHHMRAVVNDLDEEDRDGEDQETLSDLISRE